MIRSAAKQALVWALTPPLLAIVLIVLGLSALFAPRWQCGPGVRWG